MEQQKKINFKNLKIVYSWWNAYIKWFPFWQCWLGLIAFNQIKKRCLRVYVYNQWDVLHDNNLPQVWIYIKGEVSSCNDAISLLISLFNE